MARSETGFKEITVGTTWRIEYGDKKGYSETVEEDPALVHVNGGVGCRRVPGAAQVHISHPFCFVF